MAAHAPRTERIEFDGRIAWRKRYGPAERHRRMAVLRWIARRGGLTPLLPPHPIGGSDACRTEQAMIARLAAIGMHVPDVLAADETELVLSDIGTTLSAMCKAQPDVDARAALLARGFDALAELHARGGHVSQAFVRNLVVDGERIGFIDLEEDPLTVMPLAAAQARDVLFYVHSSARFLPAQRYAALLAAHVEREPAQVRAHITRVARRLRWLAPLAAIAGRRARAVAAALRALT